MCSTLPHILKSLYFIYPIAKVSIFKRKSYLSRIFQKKRTFVKSNVKCPSVKKCSFLNLIGILLKISTQGWFSSFLPTAHYLQLVRTTWLFRQWLNLILWMSDLCPIERPFFLTQFDFNNDCELKRWSSFTWKGHRMNHHQKLETFWKLRLPTYYCCI